MKMDLLFWKNKNSSIRFEETNKQFFNKYLYRMRLQVYGGRIIQQSDDYQTAIEKRRYMKQFNHGGYWGHRDSSRDLDLINVELLGLINNIKNNNPNLKIRTEEPEIQFYAETENELQHIANLLGPKYQNIILSVSGPSTDAVTELLKNGAIIHKKPGYKYKIVLRDGRCNVETKRQLLGYLESLGLDEAKISTGVKSMLSSSYDGFWSTWFYANDEKIVTFLELIRPGIVLNIHPIVVA